MTTVAPHISASLEDINRRGQTFHYGIRATALQDPSGKVIGAVRLMHAEERKP